MNWKILIIALIVIAIAYVAYTSISKPSGGNDQNTSKGGMAYGFNPTQSDCEGQTAISDADYCWQLYAQNSNNPEFCKKILSIGVKELCYWNIAVQSSDKELCSTVSDENLRYDCIDAIENK